MEEIIKMVRFNYTLTEDNVIESFSIIPFDENKPFLEVPEGTVVRAGIDKIVDGVLVHDDEAYEEMVRKSLIREEIDELKKALADTDYLAIKFAEGELTPEEYAPHKEQRKAYRQRINELEEQLKN